MGLQDFFSWRSQTPARTTDAVADEEPPADVDEPPDHRSMIKQQKQQNDFHKSTIQGMSERKESLLTKALMKGPETETPHPEIQIKTDLSRRRSMISNASMTSTAELTSDGGLTSPARTNTPSPPPPGMMYGSFAPYSLGGKPAPPTSNSGSIHPPEIISVSPNAQVTIPPKKRCISFACSGGTKNAAPKPTTPPAPTQQQVPSTTSEAPNPRPSKIKFSCPGPKSSGKAVKPEAEKKIEHQSSESSRKSSSRSPSMTRKSTVNSPSRLQQDSTSTLRRRSQSPLAVRAKPKYIIADEKSLRSSDATRFHEFASEEPQEDDWILNDVEVSAKKMTISDTLKKENAIRKLGNEVEEEELEEDEEEDDEDEQTVNYSEDDDDDDEEEEEDDDDEEAEEDEDVSDGNETDNEAGFADSDDESDAGEFNFWTPGRNIPAPQSVEASTYRASAHRAASASSIDSLNYMDTMLGSKGKGGKKPRRRAIKIRPGTPELPDSTDFVCGTLDEDRPMENAYIACIEARKHAKHKQTPQDIDPSFPTSDPEDEEDDEDLVQNSHNSDEVWIHGKFEESDHEGRQRTRRKSPLVSPRRMHSPPPGRRLHSPPPPKQRHRSPPPRKLFGHSPKRMRSPPPARAIRSPQGTPNQTTTAAIRFGELASRPGLTHTKSLPRAPNAFGRQYRASRIVAAAGNAYNDSDGNDGHVRGAIDIVKGLERKRLRRKEKLLQKHCKGKNQPERKMQTGKGAQRMREVGLNMAGKTVLPPVPHNPYMMSA